jgi:hypothetical protein
MNRSRGCEILFAFAALVLASNPSAQATKLDGPWQGELERDRAVMTVQFDFQTGPDGVTGRFTSESQRVMEYPLDKVEYSGATIHWVLGGSLIFDGTVAPQGIDGTFQEGRHTERFLSNEDRWIQHPIGGKRLRSELATSFFPVRYCAPRAREHTPESFFCTEAGPNIDGEHLSFSRTASLGAE